MAATISSDMDKTDKVVGFIDECRAMGLSLLSPDVNAGEFQFSVDQENQILYGLGAIKGLGEGPVESIIEARKSGGAFVDLFDFCARVDARKVNKRALDALIRAGALDQIGPAGETGYRRALMLMAMDEAIKISEQQAHNANSGMGDLFGNSIADSAEAINYGNYHNVRALTSKERLAGEKETLGLFLTGHPIDEYRDEMQLMALTSIAKTRPGKEPCTVAGMLIGIRIMKNKRGENFAFLTLDDKSGRLELSVFAEKFTAYRELLVKDAMLVVKGTVSEDGFTGGLKMLAESIQSIYSARCAKLKTLELQIDGSAADWVDRVQHTLNDYREGICPVVIDYSANDAAAKLALGEDWRIQPRDELIAKLRDQFGTHSVTLRYL